MCSPKGSSTRKPDNLKALPGVAAAYDLALLDGAAKLEGMLAAAVKISDAILIPVQPSPYDIWAVADLVELIRARQTVAEGRPEAAFVISRTIRRTRLGSEVAAALAEHGLPVLRSATVQRQRYPQSAAEGRSVFEGEGNAAAAEIGALADELADRFLRGQRRHVA